MTTFWKSSKQCLLISHYSTTYTTLWTHTHIHTSKLFYFAYIHSHLSYGIIIILWPSQDSQIPYQPSGKGPSVDLCWPQQTREVHSYKERSLAHWHSSSTVIFRMLCLPRGPLDQNWFLSTLSNTTTSTSHFDNHTTPTQTPQLFESQLYQLTLREIIQWFPPSQLRSTVNPRTFRRNLKLHLVSEKLQSCLPHHLQVITQFYTVRIYHICIIFLN